MYPIRLKKRQILIFVSIIGMLGLIVRMYLATLLPTHWDVGHYLYWGKFVLDGKIPFEDFFARHPLYIYLMALSIKSFGHNLFAAFMVSVIASFLTIFVLYEVSSLLYDKKTGLIACIIYAFAPTILTYSTVPDERSAAILFTSIAIVVITYALKRQSLRFFFLFGVILGFSIYVHKAVGVYLLTVPLLLAYVNIRAKTTTTYVLKKTLIQLTYMVIGFCIPAFAIYVYYGLMTDFQWAAYAVLGFGNQQESISYFMLGETFPLTSKFRIFHVAIREWLYLAVPAAIFMGVLIERTSGKSNCTKRFLMYLLGLSFLVIILIGGGYSPQSAYGAYEPDAIYKNAFILTLFLLIAVSPALLSKVNERFNGIARIEHGNAVVAYWFLSTALLISLYGTPLVNHYYWLAPITTTMTAVVLRIIAKNLTVRERSDKSNKPEGEPITRSHMKVGVLFVTFILISAGFIAGMLINTPMTWRNQSVHTLHEVADYIKEHTSENEKILTDNPAIAVLADRQLALNVMPYHLYMKVGPEPYDPLPYDPFNLIPNVQEIVAYMENGYVKYIVETAQLSEGIKLHPIWEQTFNSRYTLETTIDGVSIYVFEPE